MSVAKPKGSLLIKKQTADIISLIIYEFKDQFKNINIEDLRKDYHYIQNLMESIEKKFSDKSLFDQANIDKIDKNDILIQLIKGIFPKMTTEELEIIQNVVNLILCNDLVIQKGSILNSCMKFFFQK